MTTNGTLLGMAQARKKLTKPAFVAWMHMHILSDAEMSAGRGALAKTLQFGAARFDDIVRELAKKGFLTVVPSEYLFGKTTFCLAKRCVIPGKSNFVMFKEPEIIDRAAVRKATLSSVKEQLDAIDSTMLSKAQAASASDARRPTSSVTRKTGAPKMQMDVDANVQKSGNEKRAFSEADYKAVSAFHAQEILGEDGTEAFYAIRSMLSPRTPLSKKDKEIEGDRDRKKFERSENSNCSKVHVDKSASLREAKQQKQLAGGVNTGKLSAWKDKQKVPSLKKLAGDRIGSPIPWDELDKNGSPKVTFEPDAKRRKELVELLTSDGRRLSRAKRTEKQQVVRKLGEEFKRIYVRYRRFEGRESGNQASMAYAASNKEMHLYDEAAQACILKGITPTQYLQHWHENFSKMTHGQCFVPPMTFLKNAQHADSAALAIAARKAHGGGEAGFREGYTQELARRLRGNKIDTSVGFGNEKLLHPKLRGWLKQGGWDVSELNNAYLATLQVHAIEYCDTQAGKAALPTLASDIPKAMRKMAQWASENVFESMTYGERGVYLGLLRGDMS